MCILNAPLECVLVSKFNNRSVASQLKIVRYLPKSDRLDAWLVASIATHNARGILCVYYCDYQSQGHTNASNHD